MRGVRRPVFVTAVLACAGLTVLSMLLSLKIRREDGPWPIRY